MIIDVVIPAFNEADAIGNVINDIPKQLVRNIIVVNNGSIDQTATNASNAGAIVLNENRKGYGYACLKGINWIKKLNTQPDIVVFIDGDYSDHPEQMPSLIAPISNGTAELVIGSRALGARENGSMMPQQIFGNWLATRLMRIFYQYKFTDLGPFRAVTWRALQIIDMQDQTFGWTVEMQVKALKKNIACTEVAVNYRKRIGVSKVTGTVKGSVLAGYKILYTIFKYAF